MINVDPDAALLCYLLLAGDAGLREQPIRGDIHVPAYWSHSPGRVRGRWADDMIRSLPPLPVDHRYGHRATQRVVEQVTGDIR